MSVDYKTWAAIGVIQGNSARLLQPRSDSTSEDGPKPAAGDMSHPVAKQCVEVDLDNTSSMDSRLIAASPALLPTNMHLSNQRL